MAKAKKNAAYTTKKAKFTSVATRSSRIATGPALDEASIKISPPDKINVEVLLSPTEIGLSPFSGLEAINASNVEKFKPSSVIHSQAVSRLADLGFKIIATSPYSISVEGTPKLFTDTFGTELEPKSLFQIQTSQPLAAKAFFEPAEGAEWNVPTSLTGFIERAYIQPPPIYFESMIPPKVNYFHLNVPHDVALLTGASAVHRQGITGKGVTVVMIDTGFYRHKYYNTNRYNINVMLAPGASNVNDDEVGHGTAEAANVLANAPDVSFIMLKSGGNATAAMKAAIDLKPDVITCSWGYDLCMPRTRVPLSSVPNTLKPLELEVSRAVALGITVVFSSGNGHVGFPGMHPDVISVGGCYMNEDSDLEASNYASAFDSKPYPGRHVPDLCGLVGMKPHAVYIMLPLQPGCKIDRQLGNNKKFPDGDETKDSDGWSVISGTSAAAPQIAGICALLKQKNPSLGPQEIKRILLASTKDCTKGEANDQSNNGTAVKASEGLDGATGFGFVDAEAAFKLA
ncbi:S8 family serine peptidase [Flavisolibacter sp. BT320]|nr:S8 family serine peptidase [Flavisolibacter longurius]